jgi:O-acetyl-ADP-ribose deacetylase (regulator of RNase III)
MGGMPTRGLQIVEGDLLNQPVEVIVNSWNRNIIPWWLLLPQGVSGAIKRKSGLQPFKEVARVGPMKLGRAVLTSAGRLHYKGIIHVAGINMLWRGTEYSVRESTKNALHVAFNAGFKSIAFPLIGTGSGGFSEANTLAMMEGEIVKSHARPDEVRLVRFKKP